MISLAFFFLIWLHPHLKQVADRETELDPALQQLVSTLMESVRVMTDTGVDLPALDDPDIASDAAPVAAEA